MLSLSQKVMHKEFEYPKSEEVIEAGVTPPGLGTFTPSPAYLPEKNGV